MPGVLWKLHADNKYAHLLALLVVFFILTPLFGQTERTAPVISFVLVCTLFFTMRAIELRRRTRHACTGLLLFGFALDILSYSHAALQMPFGFSATALYLLIMLFTIATMMQRLFTTSQVTWDTILGGISTYLLLGFFWALLYFTLHELHLATFHMVQTYHPVYLVYFSFTTLTTVGYGDIVPTNGVAMMLANLESLIGQFFLTVFIARLIGLHLVHHGR